MRAKEREQLRKAIEFFTEDSDDGWDKGMRILYRLANGKDSRVHQAIDAAVATPINLEEPEREFRFPAPEVQ